MNTYENPWSENNPFFLDILRSVPETQINVSTNESSKKNKNELPTEKTSRKILMSPGENTTTVSDSRISTDRIYEQLPQPTTPTNYLVSSYYENGVRNRLNNFLPATTTATVETNISPSIVETRVDSSTFIPYEPHSSKKRKPNYVVGSNNMFPKKKFVRYFTGETSRQQQQMIGPQNLEYMMIGSPKSLFEGSDVRPSLIILPNLILSEEVKDKVDKLKSSISQLTYSKGPKDREMRKKVEKAFRIIKFEIEKAKTEDEILEILDKFLIDRYPFLRVKVYDDLEYGIGKKSKTKDAKTQSNKPEKKNVETQFDNKNIYPYKKNNFPKRPISTSANLNLNFVVPRSRNISIHTASNGVKPSTLSASKITGNMYQGRVYNLGQEITYRKSMTNKIGLNKTLFIGSNIPNSIIELKFEIPTNIKERSNPQQRLHKMLLNLRKVSIHDEDEKAVVENTFLSFKKELEDSNSKDEADQIISKRIKSAASFPFFAYLYRFDYEHKPKKKNQNKPNEEKIRVDVNKERNEILPIEKTTPSNLNVLLTEYYQQSQPFYWQYVNI